MNMTSQGRSCAVCGCTVSPDTLKGLCPRCLMGLHLETSSERKNPEAGVPALEEVAKCFPQLELLECLGRGGMGVVYKARQPKLDRLVALKVLLPPKAGIPQEVFAERFSREARALARLSHPGIVAVHDYGEAGGFSFLLMEYVEGVNLRSLLKGGKLPPDTALAIVPKICEALQFAHQNGVVHRDIKPENILLDKQGQVKIADFGIAKMLGAESDQNLTQGKDVMGTPHYMAPEQIERPGNVDHRADIFSLGVVFYEMLTGELPLGKFEPPSSKVRVDVRLDEVVLHALEKEPARRYQHAQEVKTDLETIGGSRDWRLPASFNRIPLLRQEGDRLVTNWPVVLLVGLLMSLLLAGGLAIAAGVSLPQHPSSAVLMSLVVPVICLVPLWLFLEVVSGKRRSRHSAAEPERKSGPPRVWLEYVRALLRLAPMVLAWWVVAIFLYPRLAHVLDETGLVLGGGLGQILQFVLVIFTPGIGRLLLGLFALLLLAEWLIPFYRQYRGLFLRGTTALINGVFLLGLVAFSLITMVLLPSYGAVAGGGMGRSRQLVLSTERPFADLDMNEVRAADSGGADVALRRSGPEVEALGLLLWRVPNEHWPRLQREAVQRKTSGNLQTAEHSFLAKPWPQTFIFRTQQGSTGILQIRGYNPDTQALTLRYRVADSPSPSSGSTR